MLSGISPWSILLILIIVVVLFGTKKLRNIGSDLGAAMKSFKKSSREDPTTEKNIDDNNKKTSIMFDLGFWDLFFLFLLALFVLGPERLPVFASYLGKQFGKVQRYFSNVKNQIDDEVDSTDINKILKDQELSITELQKRIKETQDESARDKTD